MCVETLFGFLDFDKFKQQILKVKDGANKDYSAQEMESSKGKLELKEDSDFNQLNAEDMNDKTLKWKKAVEIKEGKIKGITGTIWQRPMKNSKLNLLKSDIVMKDISMDAYCKFIDELEKHNEENE